MIRTHSEDIRNTSDDKIVISHLPLRRPSRSGLGGDFVLKNTTFRAPAISKNVTLPCETWLNCYFTELLLDWTVTWLNCYLIELLLDWTVTLLSCYFTGLLLVKISVPWARVPEQQNQLRSVLPKRNCMCIGISIVYFKGSAFCCKSKTKE